MTPHEEPSDNKVEDKGRRYDDNFFENSKNGYIRLYRSIQDHWIFKNPEYYKWWSDILLEVNYAEAKVPIKNELIYCGRGQTVKSYETWAERWRVDKGKVRRFFELLKQDNMIKLENLQKTTRLTVCNYDTYNEPRTAGEPQTNRRRTQTIKNKKNNKIRDSGHPQFSEVEKVFIQQGGTNEMAKAFYDKHTATGWMLRGSAIKSFSFLVPSFIRNWNDNETRQQQATGEKEKQRERFKF
jgi:hypothetical protein